MDENTVEGRDRPEAQEVEITPEMMAAGLSALRAFAGSLPERLLIVEIYSAMRAVSAPESQELAGAGFMAITNEAFEAASERGRRLEREYGATSVRYDRTDGYVKIELKSKKELCFRPSVVRGLEHASPEQLDHIELGPAGVSIYFPDMDVDLSVPGLYHDADGKRIFIR
jgi:hypothetical protein